MSEIDFERVSALLNIIKQCADIGGMNNIVSEAQAELVEINADAGEAIAERAAEEAKKAQAEAEEVEGAEDNPPPPRKEEEPKYVAPAPKAAAAPAWKPDQEPKPETNGRRA